MGIYGLLSLMYLRAIHIFFLLMMLEFIRQVVIMPGILALRSGADVVNSSWLG